MRATRSSGTRSRPGQIHKAYLNDPSLADAIMDRLVHRSHKIHLHGEESMRKRTGNGKDGAKD